MPLTKGMPVGPYEIVEAIVSGESGEVYRARDARVGRVVALRTLRAPISDLDTRDRFAREAHVLSRLSHPNIGRLYEVGREGDIDFLVMEHLGGDTLAERIGRGPMPMADVLAYAIQICDALDHAHREGIVHGDLSPANVVFAPRAKLCNFRLVSTSPTAPSSYTAPEVIDGREPDARSDIWAFGCIAYEMLTGRRAFVGTGTLLVGSIRRDEPAPVSSREAQVPAALDALVNACLAKDPGARPQRAGELLTLLQSIEPAVPVTAVGEVAAKRLTPTQRGARVAGVAGMIAASAALAAWSLWPIGRTAPVPATATSATADSTPAAVSPPVASPPETTPTTETAAPPPRPPATPSIEPRPPAAAPLAAVPSVFRVPDDHVFTRPWRHAIALSPDGDAFAYIANRQIYLRRSDESPRVLEGSQEDPAEILFSPDGSAIAYFMRRASDPPGWTLKKLSVEGGEPVALGNVPVLPYGASWARGVIMIGQGAQGIVSIPEQGGSPTTVVSVAPNELAASPYLLDAGKTVVFTLLSAATAGRSWNDADIVTQTTDAGERRVLATGHDGRVLPSGALVYVRDSKLVVDGKPRAEEVMTTPTTAGPGAAQFSISLDSRLAYVTPDLRSIVTIDRWINADRTPRP
jgi:hypothetical protein